MGLDENLKEGGGDESIENFSLDSEAMAKDVELIALRTMEEYNILNQRSDYILEELEIIEEYLEIYPNDYWALVIKAFLLYKLNLPEKSINYYKNALEIDSNKIGAYSGLALSFSHMKEYEEALDHINKALNIEPNNVFLLVVKGYILFESNKSSEALLFFNKAREINSNHHMIKILEDKSWDESIGGNLLKSLELLELYLKLFPDDYHALISAGMKCNLLKQYENAINYFKNALDIDSNKIDAYKGLALSFAHMKEYEEALDYINKTLIIEPNNEELLMIKGNILFASNKVSEALLFFNKVKEINPNNNILQKFIRLGFVR